MDADEGIVQENDKSSDSSASGGSKCHCTRRICVTKDLFDKMTENERKNHCVCENPDDPLSECPCECDREDCDECKGKDK